MYLAPDASLDDGLLDIALSMDGSKLSYLANLPRVFKGTHVDQPGFEMLRGREIEVSASEDYRVYADGDPIGQLPARISVVPRAIRVLCPA
jgi:diacylglycerol kinase family enzyme